MSSEATVLSPAKALASGLLADLGPGAYRIEYHDNTHMPEGEFRPLLALEVRDVLATAGAWGRDGHPFYTIAPAAPPTGVATPPSAAPSARTGKGSPSSEAAKAQADKAKEQAAKELDKLRDVLGQSLSRVGILPARAEREVLRDLHELSQGRGLVVIPDTNSLANGVLHFLLRALSKTQVWLLPVAVSLTTIQNHDAKLKSLVNTAKPGNLQTALRSRSLVNATLALLERCRAHVQVLEVDPQLLRYMRGASDKGTDPDQGEILEDRLLLETIHASLGAMRTQAARRVVTADVFLSRILRAEGVQTLALQSQRLPDKPTPCLRYDPIARAFVGATPTELLWDLAHTFSSVRLVDPRHPAGEPLLVLEAYWDGKTARDWQRERLHVRRGAPPSGGSVGSTAVLPDTPFLRVLDLAGALLKGPGSLGAILERIPDVQRPTEQVARNAAEVLVRAGFASQSDEGLSPSGGLIAMDEALAAGGLDFVSNQWEHAYAPYRALIGALRERGKLAVDELPELLERSLGSKPAKRACMKLIGMAVDLGQAWLTDLGLRDGTGRPSDEEAVAVIRSILAERARDGLLSVAVLLPAVCEALRMSPWAAAAMFQRLQQSSALPDVTFSASLPPQGPAPEPVPVVRGSLSDLSTEKIPLDSLRFGDSLVYTVSWRP